jgi:hypothetical protein
MTTMTNKLNRRNFLKTASLVPVAGALAAPNAVASHNQVLPTSFITASRSLRDDLMSLLDFDTFRVLLKDIHYAGNELRYGNSMPESTINVFTRVLEDAWEGHSACVRRILIDCMQQALKDQYGIERASFDASSSYEIKLCSYKEFIPYSLYTPDGWPYVVRTLERNQDYIIDYIIWAIKNNIRYYGEGCDMTSRKPAKPVNVTHIGTRYEACASFGSDIDCSGCCALNSMHVFIAFKEA